MQLDFFFKAYWQVFQASFFLTNFVTLFQQIGIIGNPDEISEIQKLNCTAGLFFPAISLHFVQVSKLLKDLWD